MKRMKKHYLLSALTLTLLANLGHAAEGAGAAAAKKSAKPGQMLSSGIATQYVESSVRAQDDFYENVNGKWLKTVEIPADKSRWGSFSELAENSLSQLRGIIDKAAASKPAKATDAFETAIAQAQWTKVEMRDPIKAYSKVNLADLNTVAPGFDWKTWLAASDLSGKATYLNVSQPTYLKSFMQVANDTSIDTW